MPRHSVKNLALWPSFSPLRPGALPRPRNRLFTAFHLPPSLSNLPPSTLSPAPSPFLTVQASGSGPFQYQWLKGKTPIAGATAANLRLPAIKPADAGDYTVQVSNDAGNTTSQTAAIVVHAAAANPAPPLPGNPAKVFSVLDNGALADGITNNAAAIQKTIAAAVAAGGGIVEIPAATKPYLCGPLTMASKINLQIDPGATLLAAPYGANNQPGAYPVTGNTYPDFISARNLKDIAITGGGTIDGQGAAWWTAFRQNSGMPHRPFMIRMSGCERVLITGVTLTNSPMFHAALSSCNNLTCFAVTVRAPATGPNTDGVDPSGSHQLIQNCNISVGDDNIAVKAGSAFCSDLTIADCIFGTGHGLSIGGQSNRGLDGMTVKDCVFTGTTAGLRLKADATQGGIVQNITYSHLVMNNVQYPIEFYSYYKQVGNPGALSGGASVPPDRVKQYNATPPNSLTSNTLPAWKNITINNLKATGTTGNSIIWGLALDKYMIENVTLHNVQIPGRAFDLFNTTDVQFTGTTDVGRIATANALAITAQPQDQSAPAGGTATFNVTAVGASGVKETPPTCQWKFNDKPLADGPQADGTVASPAARPPPLNSPA